MPNTRTLYERLSGYEAIAAVASDLLPRLQRGMRIGEGDWTSFLGHFEETLDAFKVPASERAEVIAFVQSTKREFVEA